MSKYIPGKAKTCLCCSQHIRITELEAENKRLREALSRVRVKRDLAFQTSSHHHCDYKSALQGCGDIALIALKALKREDGE